MRRFLVFLIIPILIGCEIYEQPSNPQLNLNGRWDVTSIEVVNNHPNVIVVNEDRASISGFTIIGTNNNGQLMLTQDYYSTLISRRFDISSTKWEFDYNSLRISDDSSDVRIDVWFLGEQNVMKTNFNGQETRFSFDIDTYGSMPSNVLTLVSQSFHTPINGNQTTIRSYLVIKLHRY